MKKIFIILGLLSVFIYSNSCQSDDYINVDGAVSDVVTKFSSNSGLLLSADSQQSTYGLINSVFATGNGNVIEAPDCAHSAFGDHITQVYDPDIQKDVFSFILHVTPDNDRCKSSTDRQRNEIKIYDKSPEVGKAFYGQTVTYRWKFKLDSNFKASQYFSHIHQIKPYDGDSDIPIITFTARNKNGKEEMELLHCVGENETSQKKLTTLDLSFFKGHWIEVVETITYSDLGEYKVTIKRLADNVSHTFQKSDIKMWRTGTTFCRPKWGLYRSLKDVSKSLRDEEVRFNDFSIIRS